MKVRELIATLAQFDPDEDVGVYDNGPGDGANAIIAVELSTESLVQRPNAPFGTYDKCRIVLIQMDGHA